jgi:hydrogenase small subunit
MKCSDCREVDSGGILGDGLSRRDFVKVCTTAAVAMGLDASFGPKMAEAATAGKRLPVVWISGQECTGCTETLLRATHPTLEHLILDLISLDYHETLNSGCGQQSEEALKAAIAAGGYVMVAEGSFPMKDGGIYCKIGGRPVIDILAEAGKKAAACIAIGSCSAWGGMPSATPNPTGAASAAEVLKAKGVNIPVMNIPGCPPNPYNFLSAVLYFVTFKKLPQLDELGRPKFAYGRLIHENCERRPHFDAGRFAEKFGDDAHRQGFCLYKLGCKGPETYNNCSTLGFGDVGGSSWPVGMGAPCFGCSEKGVGYTAPLHSPARLTNVTPPSLFSPAEGGEKGHGMTAGAAAVAAGVVGAIVGAGLATAKGVGKAEEGKK